GVDVDGIAAGAAGARRAAFGLPDGVAPFVHVAPLVPEKDPHRPAEAFARGPAQPPDARLALGGAPRPGPRAAGAAGSRTRPGRRAIAGAAGPAEGAVGAAVERTGTGDAVALLGHRSDARALVAAADVFAFSSLSEGLPGAVVEALVLGTPVAAFAIPPVAELTEGDRHAWLAEPGDPDALAAA